MPRMRRWWYGRAARARMVGNTELNWFRRRWTSGVWNFEDEYQCGCQRERGGERQPHAGHAEPSRDFPSSHGGRAAPRTAGAVAYAGAATYGQSRRAHIRGNPYRKPEWR